jgi:hypothetical protein
MGQLSFHCFYHPQQVNQTASPLNFGLVASGDWLLASSKKRKASGQ